MLIQRLTKRNVLIGLCIITMVAYLAGAYVTHLKADTTGGADTDLMERCVSDAKAVWQQGMSRVHTRDDSTAVAIIATKLFDERKK